MATVLKLSHAELFPSFSDHVSLRKKQHGKSLFHCNRKGLNSLAAFLCAKTIEKDSESNG